MIISGSPCFGALSHQTEAKLLEPRQQHQRFSLRQGLFCRGGAWLENCFQEGRLSQGASQDDLDRSHGNGNSADRLDGQTLTLQELFVLVIISPHTAFQTLPILGYPGANLFPMNDVDMHPVMYWRLTAHQEKRADAKETGMEIAGLK